MSQLSDLLTDDQLKRLAAELAKLMASGWGTLTIEIVNHRARFIRPQLSFDFLPEVIKDDDLEK